MWSILFAMQSHMTHCIFNESHISCLAVKSRDGIWAFRAVAKTLGEHFILQTSFNSRKFLFPWHYFCSPIRWENERLWAFVTERKETRKTWTRWKFSIEAGVNLMLLTCWSSGFKEMRDTLTLNGCGDLRETFRVLFPTLVGVGLLWVVLQFLFYSPSSLFYVEMNDWTVHNLRNSVLWDSLVDLMFSTHIWRAYWSFWTLSNVSASQYKQVKSVFYCGLL